FNQMAGKVESSVADLQASLDQQRRFTADASHELRTPLTRMQLATSSAFSGSEKDVRDALVVADTAAKDMGKLVQQLLDLAKADTGEMTARMAPLDFRVVVAEAVDKLGGGEIPVELRLDDKPVPILGDSSQLERVIFNLIENSRRHTAEGCILVELYGNGEATLKVTDTGKGIAREHLPHVLDRFYRVDSSRDRDHGGAGLGLAIVQEIVHAHGGVLRIESEVDLGTVITVSIPLK
ncbi:MAG: HAMP domain-containing sensor histidine kinase, partial [Fimbriimonadaceae bacterium]